MTDMTNESAPSSVTMPAHTLGTMDRVFRQGERVGPFAILKHLGTDSISHTYKARYDPKSLPVLMRITRTAEGPTPSRATMAFQRDVERAKILRHVAIQRILFKGSLNGQPYYAAEYVRGISLRRVVATRGKLDLSLGVDLAVRAGEALEYAHARGVYHRAISPSSLVITPERELRFIGFGITSDLLGDMRTRFAQDLSTPLYLAPEQVTDCRRGDARTDIYSLGAVLYHVFTGEPAFRGDSEEAVYLNLAEEKIEDPRVLNPTLPSDLTYLILCMINLEPDKRYQNATQLLTDLREIRDRVCRGGDATRILLAKAGKSHRLRIDARQSRRLLRRLVPPRRPRRTDEERTCRHRHAPKRPPRRSPAQARAREDRRLAMAGILAALAFAFLLFVLLVRPVLSAESDAAYGWPTQQDTPDPRVLP